MNALRYETASLIAADPRPGLPFDPVHNRFGPVSGHPSWRTPLATVATPPSRPILEILKLHPPTGEPLLTDFLPDEIVAARGAALVYAGRPSTVDLAVSVSVGRLSASGF